MPTWISTSMPAVLLSDTACPEAGTATTSPANGASSSPQVGSIAMPSPIMPAENTGSGVAASGMHQPSRGALSVSVAVIGCSLLDRNPVDGPHRVERRTREPQAQIVHAALHRQRRAQHRDCGRCGLGKRQPDQRLAVTAIEPDLQFPDFRARIPDSYLVRVGADLVVEWQRPNRGFERARRGKIDGAPDPAGIHDVELNHR